MSLVTCLALYDIGGNKLKEFDRVHKYYDSFIKLFNLNKMDEIRDVLELQGNEVVIDIGGGTGRLAEYLSQSCRVVYVLDESKGMLSKVRANSRVVTTLGNALDAPFDSNWADVVVISDVLHHIENQSALIEEISRVLKKDGKLLILDFEKKHIKTKILRAFEYILFGRLYFRTSKEVVSLLKDRFKITKFIDNKYYFIVRGEKNA